MLEVGRFVEPDEHARSLYDILLRVDFDDHHLAGAQLEWLAMSVGVRAVDIDTDPLGDAYYCGNAAAWDGVRSEQVSRFSSELLRFLFCWGSLECTARLAGMRKTDRTRPWLGGRIAAMETTTGTLTDDLARAALDLRNALREARAHGVDAARFEHDRPVEPQDAVLLAGAVRNAIAHGWSEFPEGSPPDPPEFEESTRETEAEVRVLVLARRAALLTMQAVLAPLVVDPYPEGSYLDNRTDEERLVQDALLDIHLPEEAVRQETLPLD